MWDSYLERTKMENSLMTFLLLFNNQKFGKSSLFGCNGYRHAIFIIIFLWILSRISKKSRYKRKKWRKSVKDFFIAVLLHFYDLNYLNLTKSWLSNQKSGMVPEVTLILNVLMNIVTKFQVSIFKNDEVRGGGLLLPPPYVEKVGNRGYVE